MTLTRRGLLLASAALASSLAVPRAWAQDASAATTFIQTFGTRLVDVVNGGGSASEKETTLRPLIDSAVDVDGIARFCLGRFVQSATPAQLTDYERLFHSVLLNNITSKIGEYRGVSFRLTESSMRGSDAYVGTVVQRPNSAPVNVRWVVSTESGAMKIVDVIAEGTSLRLTQRSDYASYLSQHANNVGALIDAMRHQVQGNTSG